jgi:hypothetical protein
MNTLQPQAILRGLMLAAALAASTAATAAVGPAGAVNANGSMDNIGYGAGGNIFQLQPMLFVQGLGNANDPLSIATLNPLLQYSLVVSGAGTSLMKINYSITNSSATESFNQLRFMLFANPDGDSVNFIDRVSETWGAAATGDPERREAREFIDPSTTLLSSFQVNGNLTEGTTACLSGAGCDATLGLQWNAPLLGPKETWLVSIGLSDDGQHLSTRFLDVLAVNTPNTTLTLSGVASITAVPLPFSALLFGSGLMALGASARQRRKI